MWVWCPNCFNAWSREASDFGGKTRTDRKVGDIDADEGHLCCIFGCMNLSTYRRARITDLPKRYWRPVEAAFRLGGRVGVKELLREAMTDAQEPEDDSSSALPRLR